MNEWQEWKRMINVILITQMAREAEGRLYEMLVVSIHPVLLPCLCFPFFSFTSKVGISSAAVGTELSNLVHGKEGQAGRLVRAEGCFFVGGGGDCARACSLAQRVVEVGDGDRQRKGWIGADMSKTLSGYSLQDLKLETRDSSRRSPRQRKNQTPVFYLSSIRHQSKETLTSPLCFRFPVSIAISKHRLEDQRAESDFTCQSSDPGTARGIYREGKGKRMRSEYFLSLVLAYGSWWRRRGGRGEQDCGPCELELEMEAS